MDSTNSYELRESQSFTKKSNSHKSSLDPQIVPENEIIEKLTTGQNIEDEIINERSTMVHSSQVSSSNVLEYKYTYYGKN